MTRHFPGGTVAALALLASILPAVALAEPSAQSTLSGSKNLVALTSPDRQIAMTFWAPPTRKTQADAGAFATLAIQQYGLIGIDNFEPTSSTESVLACWWSVTPEESVGVYGFRGDTLYEADSVCQAVEADGTQVHWLD